MGEGDRRHVANEGLRGARDARDVLIDELWRRQPLLAAINLGLGVVVLLLLLPHLGTEALVLWSAALLASQALRLRDWSLTCPRNGEERCPRLPTWRLTLVSAVTGLAWGSLALVFVGPPSQGLGVAVPFVLAGMAAGSVAVLAAHPPAYIAFLTTILGPYVAQLALCGADHAGWLALITALYGLGLGAVGMHLYRGQERMAQLYGHNDRLLAALAASRDELEGRVRARTAELEEANVVLAEEVRRRRRTERRVRDLGLSDPLTGLPNRTLLFDRLGVALARARRHRRRVAVALIDVDRFKAVNDSLGHLAGDALLRELAARLTGVMRRSDTLARFGGDEFVAVFPDLLAGDDALVAADHLHAALASPFDAGGVPIQISLSIGVAVFPEHGEEPDELLGGADTALYHAKVRGRARTELLTPMLVQAFRARRNMARVQRQAIERGEIELRFGVRRRATDGTAAALTAVAVPLGSEATAAGAAELLDTARTGGFVVALESALVQRATAAVGSSALPPPRLALALSRETAGRPHFATDLAASLEASGVPADRLELGFSEADWAGQVGGDLDPEVERLRELGARFAITDFGRGAMGLKVLRDAPVQVLRVSADLSSAPEVPASDAGLLSAVATMVRARGLDVTLPEGAAPPADIAASRLFFEEPETLSVADALAAIAAAPSGRSRRA